MDREREQELKKRHKTPYLSGKKEHKPKPIKCWVCKEDLIFSGPQGHMFTFCSGENGCGSFNQNPKAKPIINQKSLKDPRVRHNRNELDKGVNKIIRQIGRATKLGRQIGRATWGNFDKVQRQAAIPITKGNTLIGPGSYVIRGEKERTNFAHVPRIQTATIARPEVLERILKKQERERRAKLATKK